MNMTRMQELRGLAASIRCTLADAAEAVERLRDEWLAANPIEMILHCPMCHAQHEDEGEFAKRPHRTHLCLQCGHEWRPANVPTRGVRHLPEEEKQCPAP